MTSGVYAVLNTANDMAYIGSSINVETRLRGHQTGLMRGHGTNFVLTAAFKACDGQGFEFVLLEEVEPTDPSLQAAEQKWMDIYEGRLYNVRLKALRYPTPKKPYEVLDRLAARALEETLSRLERDAVVSSEATA